MRVLWLSHLVPYPPTGGLSQRSYYLMREAGRRYRVDVVALSRSGHHRDNNELTIAEEAIGRFARRIQTFRLDSDSGRLGRYPLLLRSFFSMRPYDVNWLEERSLRLYLRQIDSRYDLIHVDTIGLAEYLSELSDTPFVLNHHNIESQMMEDRASQTTNPLKCLYMWWESIKLRRWEQRWAPAAAVNTVVSSLDGDRLQAHIPPSEIKVVENGVDVEYFRPRTEPEDHDGHLVFVGGMSWYPNRDAVIWFIREIWPALLEDDPTRRTVLIGRDPPREVQRATRDGRINAPGFVNDIRPTVDRAFAYICPIRRGGGTRLKILDALAMAKPLISTGFAVEGLGLEPGKHYLQADTPSEYVDQLRRLEQDPSLHRRLAMSGRRLVKRRYAWAVVGDNLESAYEFATKRQ